MEHPLLHKYFNAELSQQEQAEFDLLLDENAEFKAAFTLEESVRKVARAHRRDTLKAKLEGFESEDVSQENTSGYKLWSVIAIAASIAIIAGLAWLFNTSGPQTDALYAANYDLYPNTVYNITRGEASDKTPEKKAFTFYEEGKYVAAIAALKNIDAPYTAFYVGQSHLALGNTEEAFFIFSENIRQGTILKAESLWYGALALIKLKRHAEAREYLETLITDGSYKKTASKALLKKLK